MAEHTAGIAVAIAVIVKHMGSGAVLLVAVAAGMPVAGLIGGPFFPEAVDMVTPWLQYPLTDGAYLIRSLGSFWTGGVGSLPCFVSADFAAVEMPVFIMDPVCAVGVVLCQNIAAIGAGTLVT